MYIYLLIIYLYKHTYSYAYVCMLTAMRLMYMYRLIDPISADACPMREGHHICMYMRLFDVNISLLLYQN